VEEMGPDHFWGGIDAPVRGQMSGRGEKNAVLT